MSHAKSTQTRFKTVRRRWTKRLLISLAALLWGLPSSDVRAQTEVIPEDWLCIHRPEFDNDYCEQFMGQTQSVGSPGSQAIAPYPAPPGGGGLRPPPKRGQLFFTTGEVQETALNIDMYVSGPERPLALHREWGTGRALIDLKDETETDEVEIQFRGFGSGWHFEYEAFLYWDCGDTVTYAPSSGSHAETFDITSFDETIGGWHDPIYGDNYPLLELYVNWGTGFACGGEAIEIILRESDGRRLHFEPRPGQNVITPTYFLRKVTYPSGYTVDIYYHGWGDEPSPCTSLTSKPALDMCFILASDEAAIRFVHTNDETEDADEEVDYVEGGFWDGTTFDVIRTTEYSYTSKSRDVEYDFCVANPPCPTDTTDVLSTVTHYLGAQQAWQESYEYTNTSFDDEDIEVSFFELGITGEVTTTPYLLRKIFRGAGGSRQFAGGHQYTDEAIGRTDEKPGGLEVATVSDLQGSIATVEYENLSTDSAPSCEYEVDIDEGHVVNIAGTTAAGGVCGFGGAGATSGAFERSGTLDAKTFENALRAEYTYDSSRRTTHTLSNAPTSGGPAAFDANGEPIIGVTKDYFPAGSASADRLVGTQQLTPRAVEFDYSSVCSPAPDGTWESSYSCGTANSTYTYAPNEGLAAGTYSDFDTDYDESFNEGPEGRLTQSAQAGWTLTSLPSAGSLDTDHVVYNTQYRYLSSSTDQVEEITDPLGARICIIYGSSDRPSALRYIPSGAVQVCSVTGQSEITLSTISSYNDDGQPLVSVDERGVTTTMTYQDDGRPSTRTLSYGGTSRSWEYEYHPDGSLKAAFVGDSTGMRVGHTSQQEGPPTTDICGAGVPDEACPEGLGWIARVTALETGVKTASGFTKHSRTEFTLGTTGLPELTEVQDASATLRRKSGVGYDYRYRPAVLERYALGTSSEDTSFTYDSHGAVTDVISPRFSGTDPNAQTAYTLHGAISTASSGLRGGSSEDTTLTFKYDAHGNVARVTDELGRSTHYVTDDFGRVIAEDSPDRGITYTRYNALNQVVQQKLGDGSTLSYTYDSRHRLATETHALTSSETIQYFYDGSTTTVIGSETCGSETREFNPDTDLMKGRLSEVRHLAGVTLFEYNAFGEVTAVHEAPSVVTVHGDGMGQDPDICTWRTVRFGRDVAGRITSVVYPSGREVTYTYASSSLYPTSVSFGSASITNIVHNVSGGLKGFDAGAVRLVPSETTWNLAGEQLIRTYEKVSGGDDLFVWDVSVRDEHGNVLVAEDSEFGQSVAFSYDAQDRLELSGRSGGGSVPTNMRGYQECALSYDGAGNRITDTCFDSVTLSTGFAGFSNTLDALYWDSDVAACGVSEVVSADFMPDGLGRTTRFWAGRHPDDTYSDLTFGHFGNLDSADVSGDGYGAYVYEYDHTNLRRRKSNPVTGEVFEFDYDAAGRLISIVTSVSGSETFRREYVYLSGEPVLMVTDDGTTVSTYVLASDHLATPKRAYAFSDASLAWAGDYEPFGRVWKFGPGGSASIEQPLRFPGQYEDKETGLHYSHFRYYDPNRGRYITPDPLGFGGGDATLFAYGRGNPLRYTDPLGLKTAVIIGGPVEESNPFGHVAIAFTDEGVYSPGNGFEQGYGLREYLADQSVHRENRVYVLDTTPAQEKAMLQHMQEYMDRHGTERRNWYSNCATSVNDALRKGGIDQLPRMIDWNPFPAANEHLLKQQAIQEFTVPGGSPDPLLTPLPGVVDEFSIPGPLSVPRPPEGPEPKVWRN